MRRDGVKLIERGFKVKFVSVTDGRMGHHRLTPDETARTRRAETLEAARRFGLDGYDISATRTAGCIRRTRRGSSSPAKSASTSRIS